MTPSSHFSSTTPFFIFFPSHCTSHHSFNLIYQQYGDIFGSRADSWGYCCNTRLVFCCRAWRNTGEHSYRSKLAPAYFVSLDISLTWFVANVACGSFPARLFDAILEDGVTVSSHNTQRLILALGKVRQLHKSLNQDSIRLLAYILLTSDDKAEQERALHLLLVDLAIVNIVLQDACWLSDQENFRNNADAYEKLSKEELLLPCDKSLSIRYKLISILYTIFLGQDRNVNCRRMVILNHTQSDYWYWQLPGWETVGWINYWIQRHWGTDFSAARFIELLVGEGYNSQEYKLSWLKSKPQNCFRCSSWDRCCTEVLRRLYNSYLASFWHKRGRSLVQLWPALPGHIC